MELLLYAKHWLGHNSMSKQARKTVHQRDLDLHCHGISNHWDWGKGSMSGTRWDAFGIFLSIFNTCKEIRLHSSVNHTSHQEISLLVTPFPCPPQVTCGTMRPLFPFSLSLPSDEWLFKISFFPAPLKKQGSKWESVRVCPNLVAMESQWPA